jgi:glycosyltransferase involved in cell wall biosynthesis
MEVKPLISVIIPTYNRKDLLVDAIRSIMAQEPKNYEIIIVDDGSTDGTEEYIKSFLRHGSGQEILPVRFFEKINGGVAAARNFGIKQARGEYLAFLDADDVWIEGLLSTVMEYFKSHKNISVVYTDQRISVDYVTQKRSRFKRNPPKHKFPVPFFIDNSPIQISSVVIKKKVLDDVGGFNEKMRIHEDVELWNRISEKYEFGYIEKPLALYRLRSDNISGYTNKKQFVSEGRKYLEIYMERRKNRLLTDEERRGLVIAEEFINNIDKYL